MNAIVESFPAQDAKGKNVPSRPSRAEAEQAVATLLRWIGEDPSREGLRDTPSRVARAYEELFSGYDLSVEEALGRTFEEIAGYDDLVLLRNIPFQSHCEHHMLPITGHAHVAYLPAEKKVVGLSKFARVVDIFARRLQTQEAMTAQIAEAIATHVKPRGVAVLVEAEHMCMSMRGVVKQGVTTSTSSYLGELKSDAGLQARFLSMARANP